MLIQIPSDVLSLLPVTSFSASKTGLNEVQALSGSQAEGMPAVQDFVALFGEFQTVLNSYAELIDYDSARIRAIIESFIHADRS